MEDSEDAEEISRRKTRRRSIRLRRQSHGLVPLGVTDSDQIDGSQLGQDTDGRRNPQLGSLWLETEEPVIKKKRRRSSLFVGLPARQPSPVPDVECDQDFQELDIEEERRVNTEQLLVRNSVTPVLIEKTPNISTNSFLKRNIDAEELDPQTPVTSHIYVENVYSDSDRICTENVNFNTELPENSKSADSEFLCRLPTLAATERSDEGCVEEKDNSFNSSALTDTVCSTPGEGHSFASHGTSNSMSPEFPVSPSFKMLNKAGNGTNGRFIQLDSSVDDSLNQLKQCEDLIERGICEQIEVTDLEKSDSSKCSSERLEENVTPSFFSKCKVLAGKVMEYVKISPVFQMGEKTESDSSITNFSSPALKSSEETASHKNGDSDISEALLLASVPQVVTNCQDDLLSAEEPQNKNTIREKSVISQNNVQNSNDQNMFPLADTSVAMQDKVQQYLNREEFIPKPSLKKNLQRRSINKIFCDTFNAVSAELNKGLEDASCGVTPMKYKTPDSDLDRKHESPLKENRCPNSRPVSVEVRPLLEDQSDHLKSSLPVSQFETSTASPLQVVDSTIWRTCNITQPSGVIVTDHLPVSGRPIPESQQTVRSTAEGNSDTPVVTCSSAVTSLAPEKENCVDITQSTPIVSSTCQLKLASNNIEGLNKAGSSPVNTTIHMETIADSACLERDNVILSDSVVQDKHSSIRDENGALLHDTDIVGSIEESSKITPETFSISETNHDNETHQAPDTKTLSLNTVSRTAMHTRIAVSPAENSVTADDEKKTTKRRGRSRKSITPSQTLVAQSEKEEDDITTYSSLSSESKTFPETNISSTSDKCVKRSNRPRKSRLCTPQDAVQITLSRATTVNDLSLSCLPSTNSETISQVGVISEAKDFGNFGVVSTNIVAKINFDNLSATLNETCSVGEAEVIQEQLTVGEKNPNRKSRRRSGNLTSVLHETGIQEPGSSGIKRASEKTVEQKSKRPRGRPRKSLPQVHTENLLNSIPELETGSSTAAHEETLPGVSETCEPSTKMSKRQKPKSLIDLVEESLAIEEPVVNREIEDMNDSEAFNKEYTAKKRGRRRSADFTVELTQHHEELGKDLTGDSQEEAASSRNEVADGRRKQRQSAKAASAKMLQYQESGDVFDDDSMEVIVPKCQYGRKRKGEQEFTLEQIYRNKNYKAPEAKKWETIMESVSDSENAFGKKKFCRSILFDNPSYLKLKRRTQKAVKNGWDQKKRKRLALPDKVVEEKLASLWEEVDSEPSDC